MNSGAGFWPFVTALIGLALAGVAFWFYSKWDFARFELEQRVAELDGARAVIVDLRARLEAERDAVLERTARLNRAEADREALADELEVCDLDSAWSVPDALYERLCGKVP